MQKLNLCKKEHADGFAKVWTCNGIAIGIDDVHKQFAIDFANMMLTSFVESQIKNAMAKAAAAQAPPKPLVTEA